MNIVIALIAGLLFGLGLAVSQMMDPAKVLNFLDVAGAWDPSLMLVMGGAVAVTMPGFYIILKRPRPLFSPRFLVPDARHIDPALLGGAALFGIGWGLAGLCPGPALAGLVSGNGDIVGFVLMMLLGYRIMSFIEERRTSHSST